MKNWTPNTANTAAEWWWKQILHPRFDNGDSSSTGGLAMALAMLNASHNRVDPAREDAFRQALVNVILREQPSCLSCDYGPDGYLAVAAEKAEIETATFPWKTRMRLDENGDIIAAVGYGAPWEKVPAATKTLPR